MGNSNQWDRRGIQWRCTMGVDKTDELSDSVLCVGSELVGVYKGRCSIGILEADGRKSENVIVL